MTTPSVAVIGLGCIGGSLVRALHAERAHVRAWSASSADAALARSLGFDVPETLERALDGADIVVIAVPVQAIAEVAGSVLRSAPESAVILHCGGVQAREALRLDDATYARVLGTHPLAGSHDSGFRAARPDLFAGCTVSIESRRSAAQDRMAKWLWEAVGAARLDYRAAAEHDELMTWISQLPQLASTALAATMAGERVDPASVGPGARDATRLAASAFDQWSAIVQAQSSALDVALGCLQERIVAMRASLAQGDQQALRDIWNTAREWRRAAEPLP